MKTLDYMALQDKDDPPYTSLGCGYTLGTWWEAQIPLVGHGELVCKAKGGFPSRKTPKDKSCSEVWFCCVVFAGIPPEGAGWELCVTGRHWRLLGTAGEAAQDLPEAARGRAATLCPARLPQLRVTPGTHETSPGRNSFSFAPWKLSWDWRLLHLLSPRSHSQWLPHGVTAQWPHTCSRPHPATPREQDDAATRARGALNVFSRWKTNNAMHSSAQHPQKVPTTSQAPKSHQNQLAPGIASHTHRGILILEVILCCNWKAMSLPQLLRAP